MWFKKHARDAFRLGLIFFIMGAVATTLGHIPTPVVMAVVAAIAKVIVTTLVLGAITLLVATILRNKVQRFVIFAWLLCIASAVDLLAAIYAKAYIEPKLYQLMTTSPDLLGRGSPTFKDLTKESKGRDLLK